jgi:hypothetical protein
MAVIPTSSTHATGALAQQELGTLDGRKNKAAAVDFEELLHTLVPHQPWTDRATRPAGGGPTPGTLPATGVTSTFATQVSHGVAPRDRGRAADANQPTEAVPAIRKRDQLR